MYNPTYHAAIELKSILTKVIKEFRNLDSLVHEKNVDSLLAIEFDIAMTTNADLLEMANTLIESNRPEEVLPVDPDRGIGEWLEERNSCSGCDDCNGDCE